jgi:hypothetical protein
MEVHHHSHTARKKWTHYFWEFLMLFLAVFCGFLAEYQLEHVIENQREKKYASSLMEDLINDTIDLKRDIAGWERMIHKTDSLRNELIKQPDQRDHRLVYRIAGDLGHNNTFLYHDRTIGQLKNAGNFRLIRKKIIADSLVEYDAWIQTTLKGIEEIYSSIISPERRVLQDQLFHTKFHEIRNDPLQFDSAISREPDIISIRKGKEEILFQYYNELQTYKGHAAARVRFLKLLLQKAVTLISLVKKEYHFD